MVYFRWGMALFLLLSTIGGAQAQNSEVVQAGAPCFALKASDADRMTACNVVISSGVADKRILGAAYNTRGALYLKTGDVDTAIRDNGRAISLTPKDPSPYVTRADAYIGLDDQDTIAAHVRFPSGRRPTGRKTPCPNVSI